MLTIGTIVDSPDKISESDAQVQDDADLEAGLEIVPPDWEHDIDTRVCCASKTSWLVVSS
eukprot:SAG31_NODE_26923_length_434_cov_0.716418_1_plen_60_part_10